MLYIFYRTINLVNGKYYFGAHKTRKLDDGYLGSGKALTFAIKKYGKSAFVRDTLRTFETEKAMYDYEREFIDESVVRNKNTYNETLGGRGGFSHIDLRGDKNPMKNKKIAAKVVETNRKNGTYTSPKRIKHLKKMTIKAKLVNEGKKRPNHSNYMKYWSRDMWINNKEKMRDVLSQTFEITSPSGIKNITNRLQEWCRSNNLPYTTLWKTSVTGKTANRGRTKGWICRVVEK